MTITRIGPGLWELRSRHGALFGTGDLHAVVTLCARMRREGWSDVLYGQPALRRDRSAHDRLHMHARLRLSRG
jgi:hypothetical protein